jgi:hypothetical protein
MKKYLALGTILTIACAQTLQAAFIVEPIAGGKAFGNYAWVGGAGGVASVTALGGTAPGLSGINSSIYGGNVSPDIYQFSYTPGTDVDNTVFSAGDPLGDNFGTPNLASGVTGGGSGMYNVYATWIVSSNVNAAGVDFSATSDGPAVSVLAVDQNTGMSGSPGGNAGWFLLGTVSLTAGNTYTVTMDAVADTFVSMRSAGVMWEPVPVPEPSTLALSLLGGAVLFGLISRRKNR